MKFSDLLRYLVNFKINIKIANNFIKQALLLTIIIYSNCSMAIGLGDIKVYSYLNEPLSAEIILTGVDELDTNNIIAELASSKDFMRTGIPRPFFLTKLKFETKRIDGITVIYLSTAQAVKNPFLDFLIQLVWPDGKIIKNYTILLDPHSDNSARRDFPVSKKNVLIEDLSKVNKSNNFNNAYIEPYRNLDLSQQLKSELTSDAIFATSLEESATNEVLLNKDTKRHLAQSSITTESDHSSAMFSTVEQNEHVEKHDDHDNLVNNNQDSALTKVVTSLQAFSEHSKRPKINYEKLFDLKPNTITVHKNEDQLAESIAMSQINSELDSLRYDSSENVKRNNSKSQTIAPDQVVNNVVSNSYLELIKRYGNDLLWTCCLVSAIIFLFHKMITSSNSHHSSDAVMLPAHLSRTTQDANLQERPIIFNHFSDGNQNINDSVSSDLNVDKSQDELNNLLQQSSNSNYDLSMIRNEELELKIALTKQYLEAGDKKSAKDILQDITFVKEKKYQDQISSLLKSII